MKKEIKNVKFEDLAIGSKVFSNSLSAYFIVQIHGNKKCLECGNIILPENWNNDDVILID